MSEVSDATIARRMAMKARLHEEAGDYILAAEFWRHAAALVDNLRALTDYRKHHAYCLKRAGIIA